MSSFWAAHDCIDKRKKDKDGAAGAGSHWSVFSCVHLIQPSFDDIALDFKTKERTVGTTALANPKRNLEDDSLDRQTEHGIPCTGCNQDRQSEQGNKIISANHSGASVPFLHFSIRYISLQKD